MFDPSMSHTMNESVWSWVIQRTQSHAIVVPNCFSREFSPSPLGKHGKNCLPRTTSREQRLYRKEPGENIVDEEEFSFGNV